MCAHSHDREGSKLTTRIMGFFELQKGGETLRMNSCPGRFWVGVAVWGAEECLIWESENEDMNELLGNVVKL